MSDSTEHTERLRSDDMEMGATEAVQRHVSRHVIERQAVSQRKLDFEHRRPRWLREMMAEATGVFFYVYPGLASTASFLLNDAEPAFSSIFQIGWAFAIGIALAIITCAPTSGGHFNPAITICFAFWQGFPWKKVPYYIFSQVFGAFIAGLLLMGQYHVQISAFSKASIEGGKGMVYNGGPANILCTFPAAGQTNLGYLFLIEFMVDAFIGIVIWAALDPANPFVSPFSAPFIIGLAYANMIWGFAPISISTNLARDLGPRIVAAIFFGGEAFSYYNYSWIALLVNIPATLFATGYYELLMRDSLKKIGTGRAVHVDGEEGLMRHITKTGCLQVEMGTTAVLRKGDSMA
ncbi:aquaporin-like protein [Delitschia confertaspora ATCC 74209]|uniref:Aquaporin-like protein n=1 Tax=Delitschia confertaspora ATCC 74209 TaxID=1513339 RepID=A0A9P4JU97_9PLEO|nr:aquaporin-like protein [Delitschia confertaspora ATCC 74209]